MEETNFHPDIDVDNLAITMEHIEMVKKSVVEKAKVVEGGDLVEIPISKESKRTLTTKGRVTWKRNQKAAAKKSVTKTTGSCELTKKRKIVGGVNINEAKKKCDGK